ncbi:MAG TPA: DUF6798 domain-containing protein [Acetobacteraceae bacterium]|jgi:hypothetical protein|nr:DUF6798 domain-containing protein [Acetobacteraceae bacterium]
MVETKQAYKPRAGQTIGGIIPAAAAALRSRRGAVGTVILIIALLLLIPPHGILTENEENYFALAERFVDGSAWPQETAIFDASPHRMLSDGTLGALVSAIGYESAQVVTRSLTVAAYALALPPLFSVFGLTALDAALAVMVMALIGEDIVGGEWMFSGYEAKVAAYVIVLAALRLVLVSERLTTAALLLAAATYVHFLVGGFWFVAAMALRLLDRPKELRRVGAATALFALLVAPLIAVIAWSRIADTTAKLATDIPPPDVIFSIIREPHHQSPFLSWEYFRDNWMPGYRMTAALLLACLVVAWLGSTRRLRVLAVWLAGLLTYLFLVLGPKFLDRDSGVLGKFYLFRPSSLILLLWLLLALAVAAAVSGRRAWLLRAALLALIGPWFLYIVGGRLTREIAANETLGAQKRLLVAAVTRATAPADIVLIDPDVETQLLDFERRTGRPTLVMWKFAPTNDAELIEWYRRIKLRQALFDQGCGTETRAANIRFLLTTPAHASQLAATCGPEVVRVGQWVMLFREQFRHGNGISP